LLRRGIGKKRVRRDGKASSRQGKEQSVVSVFHAKLLMDTRVQFRQHASSRRSQKADPAVCRGVSGQTARSLGALNSHPDPARQGREGDSRPRVGHGRALPPARRPDPLRWSRRFAASPPPPRGGPNAAALMIQLHQRACPSAATRHSVTCHGAEARPPASPPQAGGETAYQKPSKRGHRRG